MTILKLEIKDLKLISELEGSFRPSMAAIAKKIGVSKEVANYRLNRMIKTGFIKEFMSEINYRKLGYNLYRLVINLHNIREDTKKTIIAEIKQEKKAKVEVFIQTNKDLEIYLFAKDNSEISAFYNKIVEKHSEYIQQKELHLVLRRYKFKHAYLNGNHELKGKKDLILKEEPQMSGGKAKPSQDGNYELDAADQKIIEALQQNPNTPIIEIARLAKIPHSTALSKLKRLHEKGIIESINPLLNTSMVGYSRYHVDILLNNLSKKNMIIEYLTNSKNVTEIYEYIGKFDLGFEAHFQSTNNLEQFLDQLRISEFNISDYDVTLMLD